MTAEIGGKNNDRRKKSFIQWNAGHRKPDTWKLSWGAEELGDFE